MGFHNYALYGFIFSMAFIYSVLCRNLMMQSLILGNILTFDPPKFPLKFIWISLSNFSHSYISGLFFHGQKYECINIFLL